jgi:hypothetical protein
LALVGVIGEADLYQGRRRPRAAQNIQGSAGLTDARLASRPQRSPSRAAIRRAARIDRFASARASCAAHTASADPAAPALASAASSSRSLGRQHHHVVVPAQDHLQVAARGQQAAQPKRERQRDLLLEDGAARVGATAADGDPGRAEVGVPVPGIDRDHERWLGRRGRNGAPPATKAITSATVTITGPSTRAR